MKETWGWAMETWNGVNQELVNDLELGLTSNDLDDFNDSSPVSTKTSWDWTRPTVMTMAGM